MDGISLIGRVVDRRYLEGQPNPTDEFDLLYVRGVHGWSDMHVVTDVGLSLDRGGIADILQPQLRVKTAKNSV